MRLAFCLLLCSYSLAAQNAAALLAEARAAFLENQHRERYWIWTSSITRSITDKTGKVLEEIPTVTIESPIRSDGKRCNAVVAWGDGIEPYLANADPDERCTVEKEVPAVLRMEVLLQSDHARVLRRSDSEITLSIQPDQRPAESDDAARRCAGAVRGEIGLDLATSFPKRIDLTVVTHGCELKKAEFEDHYAGSSVTAAGGYFKGTVIRIDYALQRDKTGDASRDFWISVHRRSLQPFQKNAGGLMISGRLFKLKSKGPDRQGLTEVTTMATEISTDSFLKFETEKSK